MEAFLSILCEDTEIAELELQMGSFQLKVGAAVCTRPLLPSTAGQTSAVHYACVAVLLMPDVVAMGCLPWLRTPTLPLICHDLTASRISCPRDLLTYFIRAGPAQPVRRLRRVQRSQRRVRIRRSLCAVQPGFGELTVFCT